MVTCMPRPALLVLIPIAICAFALGVLAGSPPAGSEPRVKPITRHAAPITIAWGGDVTLGSQYGLPPAGGRVELAAVAPLLRAADLATVNYEGTFGPGGASKCVPAAHDCFAFQAPPANARTLRRAGIDAVNGANNHAWDYGAVGWHSTRAALQRAGVRATGAPGEIALTETNGVRIALVGFSTYPWSASMSDPQPLIKAADAEADLVVAFMHAGAEGADREHVPAGAESAFGEYRGDSRAFAHAAIDAGADLVLGSGPHVLRGLERYRGRLVAYSLGNLAGWHNFSTAGRSALSAVLTVELAPTGRILKGSLSSLRLDGTGVPHRDPSGAAARLVRALTASDFRGGRLRIDRHGAIAPAP